MNCPTCGGEIKLKRQPKAPFSFLDANEIAALGNDELYAYYKACAPVGDALFYLNHTAALTEDERASVINLANSWQRITRVKFYHILNAIKSKHANSLKPAPDEARFWREAGLRRKRDAAAKFRTFRFQKTADIKKSATRQTYGSFYTAETAYEAAVELVKAARALAPNAPAFKSADEAIDVAA